MPTNARFLSRIVVKRHYLAAVLLLFLGGCATHPPREPSSWESHLDRMQSLDSWHLEGKLGYRAPSDRGSAWVDWLQRGKNFDVHLSGPFGAGTTRINGDDARAVLRQPGRDELTAPSAADLTYWLFGWTLPVDELNYWVRGIPDPRQPVENLRLADSRLLAELTQGGWQLAFSRFHQQGNWTLPGKIQGSNGMVDFTLIVKKWAPTPDHRGEDSP